VDIASVPARDPSQPLEKSFAVLQSGRSLDLRYPRRKVEAGTKPTSTSLCCRSGPTLPVATSKARSA